jgi:hypothetical protein
MSDSNPIEMFSYLSRELSRLRLLYLHITEPIAGPAAVSSEKVRATPILRQIFGGALIANGGYDAQQLHAARPILRRTVPGQSRSSCPVPKRCPLSTHRTRRRSTLEKTRATSIIQP